jgi:phosphatidylglycerophosphate synthase
MERIITGANIITISRMICGIVGVYIATIPGNFWIGVGIFTFFGLFPDLLDGWVARTYDQCSRIGEFIDPFVDKILFYLAIIALFFHVVWLPGLYVLLTCDIISTFLHFFKNGGAVKSGKIKFILQNIVLGLFALSIFLQNEILIICANTILLFAACFAIHSLWWRIKR